MKTLPSTYRKNGYDFTLIERTGDVAIYSQSDEGKVIAYEVFEVQKYPERIIGGKVLEATEATPSNEQWGSKGYTFWNLDRARAKKGELLERAEKRILAKRA